MIRETAMKKRTGIKKLFYRGDLRLDTGPCSSFFYVGVGIDRISFDLLAIDFLGINCFRAHECGIAKNPDRFILIGKSGISAPSEISGPVFQVFLPAYNSAIAFNAKKIPVDYFAVC